MRSGVLKIYKKSGAAQFSLIPVKRDEQKGYVTKEGAILVEAAPCNGTDANGNINALWKEKIKFAISIADVAQLMDRTKEKVRLYHKFNGASKSLEFQQGQGNWAGTYMMQIQEGSGDSTKKVSVPLSNGEYELIMRLLIGAAAPKLIGWD